MMVLGMIVMGNSVIAAPLTQGDPCTHVNENSEESSENGSKTEDGTKSAPTVIHKQ